jgi:hypothetical protein
MYLLESTLSGAITYLAIGIGLFMVLAFGLLRRPKKK